MPCFSCCFLKANIYAFDKHPALTLTLSLICCPGQCRLTFDTKDAQASLRFGEIFEDGVTKIVVADVAPNSPAEEVGSSTAGKLRFAAGITADMHARIVVAY